MNDLDFGIVGDPTFGPYGFTGARPPSQDPGLLQLQQITQNQLSNMRSFQPSGMIGYPQIPGLGPFGPMLNQFTAGIMGPNFIPGPLFHSFPGGFSGVMQARYDSQQMTRAMQFASEVDKTRMQNTILGGLTMANDGVQTQAIRDKAGAMGDQLSGLISSPGGLMSLRMMSQATGYDFLGLLAPAQASAFQIHRMGKGFYRGQGEFGVSAEEEDTLNRSIADQFMRNGRYNLRETKGLNLNQISEIGAELQGRGLVGTLAYDQNKVHVSDMETAKIKSRIGEFTGVVALMREMTGSDDVSKLMEGIQSLTGGLGTMSPGQLEGQLSKFREVAKMAGISLTAMAGIVQEGMTMAQRVGMTPQAGAMLATQSVLAAHVATQINAGAGDGVTRPTFEKIYMQQMRQNFGAANSPLAQTLAGGMFVLSARAKASGKTVEEIAGDDQLIKDLIAATKEGGTVSAELQKFASGSAGRAALSKRLGDKVELSDADTLRIITTDYAKIQAMNENPFLASNIAGVGQRRENDYIIANHLLNFDVVRDASKRLGVNQEQLARDLGAAATQGSPAEQNRAIAAVIEKYGGKLSAADRNELTSRLSPVVTGQAGKIYADRGQDIHARGALDTAAADTEKVRINLSERGAVGKLLRDAGIGTQDFGNRIIGLLQDSNTGGTEFKDAVKKMFGGVPRGEVFEALQSKILELGDLNTRASRGGMSPDEARTNEVRRRAIRGHLTEVLGMDAGSFEKAMKTQNWDTAIAEQEKKRKAEVDKINLDALPGAAAGANRGKEPIPVTIVGSGSGGGKHEMTGTFELVDTNGLNIGKVVAHMATKDKGGVTPNPNDLRL